MIGAILLAAGSSTRLGKPKQLVEYQGRSLLERSHRALYEADYRLLVLGDCYEKHLSVFRQPPPYIVNRTWNKGMGNSLKLGVQTLMERLGSLRGVLISVCDQPHLHSGHIADLIATFNAHDQSIIAASTYENIAGVPAIFPKAVFDELLTVPDHKGAQGVIQSNQQLVVTRAFPEGKVDIDTPEDLDQLFDSRDTF